MTTRLIAHLGLGTSSDPVTGKTRAARERYQAVAYRLGVSMPTAPTPLVQRAIIETLERDAPVDEVVILGTPEVCTAWREVEGDVLGELLGRPYRFEPLPEGPREVVQAILAVLNERREGRLPDRIVIDTTHGFRSLPLLTTAALTVARSEWKREGEAAPELQVLYGAFEQKKADPVTGAVVAPVLDLTELVLATEWNAALDALERFGRADDLRELLRRESQAQLAEQRAAGETPRDQLGGLAVRVKDFADALVTARTPALVSRRGKAGSLVTELLSQLRGEGGEALSRRNPLVRPALKRLEDRLAALGEGEQLGTAAGVRRMFGLTHWYLQLQRPAEALALLREAAISGLMVAQGQGEASDPALTSYDPDAREATMRTLRRLKKSLARDLAAARNSVQHAGFNQNNHKASFLFKESPRLVKEVEAVVEGWVREPPQLARRGFLNLSNHPSAAWDDAQRRSALELGDGVLDDLRFPDVPIDADEATLLALQKQTVKEVERRAPAVVAVQGEHVLTHWLVSSLEYLGFSCVAAVTPREVREQLEADGTVRKETTFRFSGWRSYRRPPDEDEA